MRLFMRVLRDLTRFSPALKIGLGSLKRIMDLFLLFIKIAQTLLFLGGLAALLYGSYELGMDFWFWLRGVEVKGYVIGEEVRYVGGQDFTSSDAAIDSSDPGSRAIIQYLWTQEGGEI